MLGRHERAAVWLRVWADLGRAPRTIDAYARGLAEYLVMCERVGADPLVTHRSIAAGHGSRLNDDVDSVTGAPPTSFADFVRRSTNHWIGP